MPILSATLAGDAEAFAALDAVPGTVEKALDTEGEAARAGKVTLTR